MIASGQPWGRHLEEANAGKPIWAHANLRMDPYALPQKASYDRGGPKLSGALRGSRVEFTVTQNGAVMKRDLDCGLPLSMALPNAVFQGVAARAYENDDGSNTVTLELLHRDADLSIPLCVSATVEDAAADWHSWAKNLGLPMLFIDQHGNAEVVRDHAGITSQVPKPRRRRFAMLPNRPNFLRRRKTGSLGPVVRLQAREIIARS